jgi:hypothetical protein
MSGDSTVVHIVLPLFYMVLSLIAVKKWQWDKTSIDTIFTGGSMPYPSKWEFARKTGGRRGR